MGLGDALAGGAGPLDGGAVDAVGAAPAEHEEVALVVAEDLELGDVVGNALDLLEAQARHEVVVLGGRS